MRLGLNVVGDALAVTFAGDTMAQRYTVPYDAAATAEAARQIIAVLARANRTRTLSDKNVDDLRHHGEALWRLLLPPPVRDELRRDGEALLLELDEALVAVPWELMFDGQQFLCRRLALGRTVATRQPRRGDERRAVGTPIRVLVMACDPRGDLADVRHEGDAVFAELERHATVRARLANAPDRGFALRHLKDYDVVHFAGHADYVAARPGDSGWHLADGKLTADEIVRLGGGRPMPMVVFSNACQTGTTEPWRGGSVEQVFGLANAFLAAGVRHYIGTQWEVVDGQSARFASELYRHLTMGQRIGAAVQHARAAVIEQLGEGALAWASYVLYGDPEVQPLRRPEPKAKLSIPSGLKIAARASAPWKRPPATGMKARPAAAAGWPAARAGERAEASGARDETARRGRRDGGGRAQASSLASTRPRARSSGEPRRWLVPALVGLAVGLVVVGALAYALRRQPPLRPALHGLAVLTLSTTTPEARDRARDFEWCLPEELARRGVVVVPPERTAQALAAQPGAIDRLRARQLGLALGARWVAYGNLADGSANVFVSQVLDDRTVHADSFRLDDPRPRCLRFAADVARQLSQEPND